MSKVIGIDLGTTNSCVAVMEGGEAVVIPNAEGNRTTPSGVAFSKTGERMVGQVAKRQAITNPERTISSIKREMGSDHKVNIDGKAYTPQEISAMILQKLKSDAEAYLGQTVTEAVKGMYHNELEDGLKIYFCGNSISPTYLNNIISLCKGKRFSINVISKSGTTTETSLAFRVLRELLEKEMGVEEANKRIYATTDRAKGTLKQLADAQGWPTFVVPDDVGGRYSVLSAVGLLPIAAAGISIDDLMKGAADSMERFSVLSKDNDAYKYAAIRNILYRKGKSVEILECYEPDFALMNEWYKQLFGESEGKDNKGLFPASCIFSTDLHSMGQFIQEGSRTMFETIVDVKKPAQDLFIDPLEGNFDGLNFLANQNMSIVNRKAMEGTILAHTDGGVPEVLIEVDDLTAYNVGYLIYFFWRACACSGYLLSVNPFNQPGVESYKKNMFALLGKPGYEGLTAELEAKLK